MKFIKLTSIDSSAVVIIPWHSVTSIDQSDSARLIEIYANDSLYYVDSNIDEVLGLFAIGGSIDIYEPGDDCV